MSDGVGFCIRVDRLSDGTQRVEKSGEIRRIKWIIEGRRLVGVSDFDGFPAFYAVTWLMECDGGRENEMPDLVSGKLCVYLWKLI